MAAWALAAAPLAARDSREIFQLLQKGSKLTAAESVKLEKRLEQKPNDSDVRIQLLAFYASVTSGVDAAEVRAARAKHILWIIQEDPKEGFGLFQVATGVYRVNCEGDALADREAAERVGRAWRDQLRRNPKDDGIRSRAVSALSQCDQQQAELLLMESSDRAGLARLYADAVLGVTGVAYSNGYAGGTSAAMRDTPFAQAARQALLQGQDREFVVAGASTLLDNGAQLWADGKLDWDYTSLGKDLFTRAQALAPDDFFLPTVSTELPRRGERPPPIIRVGGNVQAQQLISKPPPPYPPEARDNGIQGTVRMRVLIGLDGSVLRLVLENGPPELAPAALSAARRWRYKLTLLNGKPCYIISLVDVNFVLQ